MDVEADPASDDHAILGKRKRSPGNLAQTSDLSEIEAAAQEVDQVPAPNVDSKRPRVPLDSAAADDANPSGRELGQSASSLAQLPLEVLQHLFSFLDPFSLGRLQCVNRKLLTTLDPRSLPPVPLGPNGIVTLRPPESIWSQSRATFMPDVPAPLQGLTEKEMLRLLFGARCQFCSRLAPLQNPAVPLTQWNAGPGPIGVRSIWPFKVQSCADCLRPRIIKEQDLILSPYSALQAGLPFACFTPSLNYVAESLLHQSSKPPHLQILKYYFRPQIDDLDKQANQIRSLAPAALAAWYKGIGPLLAEKMSEVSQIEQRELAWHNPNPAGHLWPDSSTVSSNSRHSGFHASSVATSTLTSTTQSTWPGWSTFSKHRVPRASFDSATSATLPNSIQNVNLHDQRIHDFPAAPQYPSTTPQRNLPTQAPSRGERNFHDVMKAKADRRAEIESRCKQLDPPLLLPELQGMKAFNAAIQIAKPLDDKAWAWLKSRLTEERQEQSVDARLYDSSSSYFRATETVVSSDIGPGQDRMPNILDQARQSNRDKVQAIANDFIKRCYRNGTNLTSDNISRFAVEVLEHVVTQFYAMQAQEDAALALQDQGPIENSSSGMRTRNLQLRHMRHVVDNCIVPHTDLIQKEIFQCSGCDVSEKYFPFQGLIQHFAMKHTHNFSRGQHKIHWSSEWPRDNPPYRKPLDMLPPDDSLLGRKYPVAGVLNATASPSGPLPHHFDDTNAPMNQQVIQVELTPQLPADLSPPRCSTPRAEVTDSYMEYQPRSNPKASTERSSHATVYYGPRDALGPEQHPSVNTIHFSPDHPPLVQRQDVPLSGRQITPRPSLTSLRGHSSSTTNFPSNQTRFEREQIRSKSYQPAANPFQARGQATVEIEYARGDPKPDFSRSSSTFETRNGSLNDAERFLQNFDPFENRLTPLNHTTPSAASPHTYPVNTSPDLPQATERASVRQHHFLEYQQHSAVDSVGSFSQRHDRPFETMQHTRFSRLPQGNDLEPRHGNPQSGPYRHFETEDYYAAMDDRNTRRALEDQSHYGERTRDHDRDLDRNFAQRSYRRSNSQLGPVSIHHDHIYGDLSYNRQAYDDIERYPEQEQERWDPHTQRYYTVKLRYVPIEDDRNIRDLYRQQDIQYSGANSFRMAQDDEHYHTRRAERRE